MSSKINNQPQVILFIMSCLFSHTISDPRISEAGLYCGKDKAPQKSNFIPSFIKEMENLSQLVTDHNWGTQSVNIAGFVPIYGFAQCFQDLSHTDCLLCYSASRTMLPRCLPSLSARIYLDGCFLRYDNYSFYSEETDLLRDKIICTSSERLEVQMERSVERVVDAVAKDAGGDGGFAVGEVEGVYALAQCWKTLGIDGCRDCLNNAVKKVRGCLPNSEGRVLNAGCYLRYSTHRFSNDGGGTNGGNGSLRNGAVIAAVLAIAAIVMLALSASFAIYKKLSNLKEEKSNRDQISSSVTKSSLNYKYETLEKATDYFNSSRKIGQGGSGSVFKGILPNGNVAAVKRLVFNNRQWVDEFFNEVDLSVQLNTKTLSNY